MKFFSITIFCFLNSLAVVQIKDTDFPVSSFSFISDSTVLLLADLSGQEKAAIYDLDTEKVIKRFLKDGRGPGEINVLGAHAIDRVNKNIFVSDLNSGKLLQFDENGSLRKEKTFSLQFLKTMSHTNSLLILSPALLISPLELGSSIKKPIGYLVDEKTLEIADTLFFNISKLSLDQIPQIDKVRFIDIHPKVVKLQKDRFLVAFENINSVFLIDSNSNLLSQKTINIPNYEPIEVVSHPQYGFGLRRRAVFNDFSVFKNTVFLTYGDSHFNMPFGIVRCSLSNSKKLSVSKHELISKEHSLLDGMLFISTEGKSVWSTDGKSIFKIKFKNLSLN